MGHIKEPKGVDFIVSPSVLNDEDRKAFSDAIADYRKTGEIKGIDKTSVTNHRQKHITDKLIKWVRSWITKKMLLKK